MSETPGPSRRSTRATSRAASRGPTPAPQPRRRAPRAGLKASTPLPATNNAETNAYGSAGKVDLGSQAKHNLPDDQIFNAFADARDNALTRDNDQPTFEENEDDDDDNEPDAVSSSPRTRSTSIVEPANRVRPSPTRPARRAIASSSVARGLQYEDEGQSSVLPLPGTRLRNDYETSPLAASSILQHRGSRAFSQTDLNSTFSYIAPPQANRHARSRSRSRPRDAGVAAALRPAATADEINAAEPSRVAVLLESLSRWLWQLPLWMKLLPLIVALSSLLLVMLSPALFALMPYLVGLPHAFARAASAVGSGSAAVRDAAFSSLRFDSGLFSDRMGRFESDLFQIRQQADLVKQSLRQVEQILPSALVVHTDPVTGAPEIPSDFWTALRQKFIDDPQIQSAQDGRQAAASWDTFLRKNQARIDKAIGNSVEAAARSAVASSAASNQILSREAFLELIEENEAVQQAKLAKKLAQFEMNVQRQVHRITDEATRKQVRKGHSGTASLIDSVAIANLVRNQELTLKTINYFSAPLGALTDPELSSPTYQVRQSWPRSLWTQTYKPHPAIAALERWEEASDCWCAAPSDNQGNSQLGISMPQHIEPRSVTIEHIPKEGTFSIATAPREFEIWILAPHVLPPASADDQRALVPECKSESAPAKGYVCIGGGTYDIHEPNHIQNFPLFVGAEVGVVRKAVLRVSSNWGADWTCLYRVRMHGVSERELVEAGKNASSTGGT